MISDPGPIPDFLLRPPVTDEAWARFRERAEMRMGIRRNIVMPTRIFDQPVEDDMGTRGKFFNANAAAMASGAMGGRVYDPEENRYVPAASPPFVPSSPPLGDFKTPDAKLAKGRDGARPANNDDYPEASASTGRGVVTERGKDRYADMSKEERRALAKKRGYVEQPAPNGGVATMRVLNFLRNWDKQQKAKKK